MSANSIRVILADDHAVVRKGIREFLAEPGNTGRSTGPHLDFRIRLNGNAFLDPLTLLP